MMINGENVLMSDEILLDEESEQIQSNQIPEDFKMRKELLVDETKISNAMQELNIKVSNENKLREILIQNNL